MKATRRGPTIISATVTRLRSPPDTPLRDTGARQLQAPGLGGCGCTAKRQTLPRACGSLRAGAAATCTHCGLVLFCCAHRLQI
jgi:hypothetical protein